MMVDTWRMDKHIDTVVSSYKTLAKVPRIVSGTLNSKGNGITSRWSVRNLDKGCGIHYQTEYLLDEKLGVTVQSSFGVDVSAEVLTAVSSKENFKAVIREVKDEKNGGNKKFFLEVWSKHCLKHAINLSALDIHGDVYTDAELGSLDWSPDESKLVYIAEKKIPKTESYIKRKSPEELLIAADKKTIPGKEHVHRDDWGEQMTGKIESVIVLWNFPEETFTIYDCSRSDLCAGQVQFSPSGNCLVGVELEANNIGRLGLLYCTNRPGHIFCLSFHGFHMTLSSENKAVRSPRFAPHGDLFWLQREADGPHHACHQLVRLAAEHLETPGKDASNDIIVIDIVATELQITNGTFYGIYCAKLPTMCFSEDSKRVVFSTQQHNEVRSYVVDADTGKITDISNNIKNAGSTVVLSVRSNVILATCSSLTTPDQLYVAILPERECENNIEWIPVSDPIEVPEIVAKSKVQYMTLKQRTGDVATFSAIYFGPDEDKVYPLIVWPHGGPHSAFSNSYSLETAFFNSLGFACLLINYRGSVGAGNASVLYLPSRVGVADVSDCRFATKKAIDQFPVDDKKLLLYGGSHGGFLVCHLSALFPEEYRAAVTRNPVVDLSAMANTTDISDCHGGFIAAHLASRFSGFKAMALRNPVMDLVAKANTADNPDGCSVEGGWPFSPTNPLEEVKMLQLRRLSPITYAPKVKTPTAVMLGSKDKRVPHHQGMAYAKLLKANGTKVVVYMYDDNHSLSSLPVEADNLINAADWFITHIKP